MKRVSENHNCGSKKTKLEIPERPFYFPRSGEQVLSGVYDLPSEHSPLQWWYANAQLCVKGDAKKRFGFFASFFRQREDAVPNAPPSFYDACTWAVIDNEAQKYYADSLLDPRSLGEIRKRIDPEKTDRKHTDIEGALLDAVKKGKVPRPDRLMKNLSVVTTAPFSINLDNDCVFSRTEVNGVVQYHLCHKNPIRNVSVDLFFETATPLVLHGQEGIVNNMFYYYYPSMNVRGHVCVGDEKFEVSGDGWYDREFGGSNTQSSKDAMDAWAWLSLRFSNDSQLSLYHVFDYETNSAKELVAVYTEASGKRELFSDVQLIRKSSWTSLVTFLSYPNDFVLECGSLSLKCSFSPTLAAQEFVTLLVNGGGFFEGCLTGEGVIRGTNVAVDGFLEYKHGALKNDTSSMMKRVSNFVQNTLNVMYPLDGSDEWIRKNVLGRHATARFQSCNLVCETLFAPVRSLTDRGGKSWRSLILVACCNALSRDYFDCSKYIAMAELLHVGSLIIDDIQDNSSIRRGGKCVHLEYGIPTAINAGTACYFMAPQLAEVHLLPPVKANRIYQLYFDVLRTGHAGQGLDIYGLHYLMPTVVESGNAGPLFDALEAIHTYKTGGAAGSVCLMACVLCDADEKVSAAMEKFGVSIGLAFQIVDDALNLRGFDGNLKEAGEDIRDGKVTYPVAKAMEKLSLQKRQELWGILQEGTSDEARIRSAIALVNTTDAVQSCLEDARVLVNKSWGALSPLLEESFSKNIMFTFCKFLTDRAH